MLRAASAREKSALGMRKRSRKPLKSDSREDQWSASYSLQATFEVILLAQYFRVDQANLGDRFKGFVIARLLFQTLLDWSEPEIEFANKGGHQ
jgi:hypothetical protein